MVNENAWQPIETAPKDGTPILVWDSSSRVRVTGAYWDDHYRCRCWIVGGYMRKTLSPLYWMPAPDGPDQK